MENRNGLCVLFEVKPAVGAPEAKVAVGQVKELQQRGFNPRTVGGDKGYHTEHFVQDLREVGVVPHHPARKTGRKTPRVACAAAHQASQRVRKRVEEIFGWTKTHRMLPQDALPERGVDPCPGAVRGGGVESGEDGETVRQRTT